MKKFLIAGSSLAAVAAAGSAGAVDVTLGGSIDMGVKYGVGKGADAANGFSIGDNYQSISISVAAAGTTDAGLKFGGSFGISTAEELVFNPYDGAETDDDTKHAFKLVNSSADVNLRGVGYNVSGGGVVTAGQMVAVKINSAWHEAGSTITEYYGTFDEIATTSAVCKLAGVVSDGDAGVRRVVSTDTDGNKNYDTLNIADGEYAKAGQLYSTDGDFTFTAEIPGADSNVSVDYDGDVNFLVNVDDADTGDITADAVYVGPFMEVMMTSSTTKMVVGGVCVTHAANESKTKIHMDVASRVMHVSDASIYIEGGFGKLSLSTSAYSGSVAGVGSAGDEVKIDGDLNATLSSVSFLGFSGHGAVAVDSINLAGRPNYSFGTSTNLLGLTVAVEMEDEARTAAEVAAGDANTWIDNWDASTSYDLNGMSVGIATDSGGDWAMSLGYELMGFAASSTVENVSKGGSAKAGLSIDTTLSTSLNGVGVSVGLDESLAWSIGASYAMGNSGLNIYVNYSQADGGGKIGATMSF
jgi:hypothetical protein